MAVSFLTRVPIASVTQRPESGVVWFPIVGALIGLTVGGLYAVGLAVLPPFLAAGSAVAIGALVTGGFHEDGLADTADAFGGGWDKDDVLRILKDPRQGTFGVLALVFSTLLKVGAIATLDASAGLVALVAAHALSRSAAIGMLLSVAPATEEGLGVAYASAVSRAQIWQTLSIGLVVALALEGILVLPALGVAFVLLVLLGRMAGKKAGGITGDVLGAAQQVAEIVLLLGVSAVVTNGWGDFPWWIK